MPDTLPRRGTVRFENRGERVHLAAAVPLRRGANRTAAIRAIIRFDERRLRRLALLRRASEIVGLSPAAASTTSRSTSGAAETGYSCASSRTASRAARRTTRSGW
jgi:hypothetical protein